jgi:hypothetical protein
MKTNKKWLEMVTNDHILALITGLISKHETGSSKILSLRQ